jgi:serine/threonine protein kinase
VGTAKAGRIAEPQLFRAGTIVAGTYRLLERLGSGNMGEVYRAEHLRLGRHVAVKLPIASADDAPRGLDRFRREVAVLSALDSRHVVRILDCSAMDDSPPYLVMELLQGENLRHMLERKGPLPVGRAVALTLDLCAGLRAVHAAGVIHRDLKPSNVFVVRGPDGEESCKILDFGVARDRTSDTTRPGVVLGTIRYMAPEQLCDATCVTPATDVYAAGAILYECLTGRHAHAEPTPEDLMLAILQQDVPPITQSRPELPQALAAAVERALARSEPYRFPDAESFADALRPFAPPPARPQSADETTMDLSDASVPARRGSRRSRLGFVALFGAGVAFGAGLARGPELASVQATPRAASPLPASPQDPPNKGTASERSQRDYDDPDSRARPFALTSDAANISPSADGPDRSQSRSGTPSRSGLVKPDRGAQPRETPVTDVGAAALAPVVGLDVANPYAD